MQVNWPQISFSLCCYWLLVFWRSLQCIGCRLSSSFPSPCSGKLYFLGHQILTATHQYRTGAAFSAKLSKFRGREPFAVLLHQIVVVAKYDLLPQARQPQNWQWVCWQWDLGPNKWGGEANQNCKLQEQHPTGVRNTHLGMHCAVCQVLWMLINGLICHCRK